MDHCHSTRRFFGCVVFAVLTGQHFPSMEKLTRQLAPQAATAQAQAAMRLTGTAAVALQVSTEGCSTSMLLC